MMEITYLREFIELSRLLNYTEAAERLYISQPVLSKHIKALESELRFSLFERSSKSVALTDFGRKYLPYAEKIVRQYEESELWRKEYADSKNHFVRIGLPESQELYEVRDHFQLFAKLYPKYRIDFVEMASSRLKRKYEDGSLNFFLTAMPIDDSTKELPYEYIEAAKGRTQACVHKDHPLAKKDSVTVGDLRKERVIIPPNETVFQQFIEDAFYRELGYRKEFLYSSYSLAMTMAESGTCVAVFQEEAFRKTLSEELVILDIEPEIAYSRGIVGRRTDLNEAERAYMEFVKTQLLK